MKLGLFGGSFDPIHRGHVASARSARIEAGLDRVLFLPTADPPHKPPLAASPWARFAMVELALLDEKGLFASAFELTPERTTYTVDTLDHFRKTEPQAELHLLVGADSLPHLHTWKRWRELIRLARLVVLRRPGWDRQEVESGLPAEVRDVLSEASLQWVGQPLEISSTAIRQAVGGAADREAGRRAGPPEALLPPRVLDYIRKYRLYR